MKRNEHLFRFTGKQIGDAAQKECEYHKGRIAFWRTEHANALEKVKTATVKVSEY